VEVRKDGADGAGSCGNFVEQRLNVVERRQAFLGDNSRREYAALASS